MIERLGDYPQLVWVAAVALYLVDVARRVQPGELLLLEADGRRFLPILSRVPFEFRGGELYFPGPLLPWRTVALSRWIGEPVAACDAALVLSRLDGMLPFRAVATINFMAIVILGPLLTWLSGIGLALAITAPLVYLLNLAAGTLVLARRTELGLPRGRAAWLLVDVLLCAPYGANWVKRISQAWPHVTWASAKAIIADEDRLVLAAIVEQRRDAAEEQR